MGSAAHALQSTNATMSLGEKKDALHCICPLANLLNTSSAQAVQSDDRRLLYMPVCACVFAMHASDEHKMVCARVACVFNDREGIVVGIPHLPSETGQLRSLSSLGECSSSIFTSASDLSASSPSLFRGTANSAQALEAEPCDVFMHMKERHMHKVLWWSRFNAYLQA